MANRLRELRNERGLTLRELSNQLNMTYSNIAKIERGEMGITADNLKIFSDFFDVTTDYILGVSNERKNASQMLERKLSDLDIKLLTSIENMTESQKLDILKVIEIVVKKGE